ncbi:MAG: hypothetical protein FWE87_05240 [Coriobacteriia bacterium]|nr:hypothetical protein [Coriobacteriia bacterium]
MISFAPATIAKSAVGMIALALPQWAEPMLIDLNVSLEIIAPMIVDDAINAGIKKSVKTIQQISFT